MTSIISSHLCYERHMLRFYTATLGLSIKSDVFSWNLTAIDSYSSGW